MRYWWQQLTTLASLAVAFLKPVRAQTFPSLLVVIRKRFPSVRQMTTQQFADWLSDPSRLPYPLILDARPEEEFAVSHLRGAQCFVSVEAVKASMPARTQPIVVYCSVGYRSSAVVKKLQKAGLANVWNLEGSLFAWANEGRAVYRDGTLLDPPRVHPYNAKWDQLLKPELREPLS